jgi:hypothetical protein
MDADPRRAGLAGHLKNRMNQSSSEAAIPKCGHQGNVDDAEVGACQEQVKPTGAFSGYLHDAPGGPFVVLRIMRILEPVLVVKESDSDWLRPTGGAYFFPAVGDINIPYELKIFSAAGTQRNPQRRQIGRH